MCNSATPCSAYSLIFSFQTDAQSSQLCFIGRSCSYQDIIIFNRNSNKKNIDKGFQNRELGRIVEKQMIVNCSVSFFNTANLHLGFVVASFSLDQLWIVLLFHLLILFRLSEKKSKNCQKFLLLLIIASRHRNRLFFIHLIVQVFAAENNPVLC
ncbi:hypothetical protein T01_4624 [Trichinella spiralis]|uniref:Uncharacterized protein n=1 Tax=Trichinella spiralis TaxID=6334 RepID=A0A0V1BT26_TRISP|nr:hypothetical protein T01_4624 [Trichinella spiralis]